MSELYDILVETPPTKVILLALDQGLWDCERSLNELAALCEANHMEAVASVTQKRQTPETGIVLGSGKLEEAAAAAAELGAECAVFDGELTGSQIRNISTALGGMEVIDRTMLILEIFRSRAVTNEGKLQTELALLRSRRPRLQGMGESLSRQGGGGGGGGALAYDTVKFVKAVKEIICDTYHCTFEEESLETTRLTVHLKFLAARILRHTPWQDAGLESMYTVLLQCDSRNEVCLQRINAYLRQEFDYELDHQEQVYLLIHLTKIV